MEVNSSNLLTLLQQHLNWYPRMELQDAYKLIYQSAMGPEHMVATRQEFARRLNEEFESLTPDPLLRLMEPVRVDHSLFRLNLRSVKSRCINTDILTPLLLQTSKLVRGTKTDLLASWADFIQLCERGELITFPISAVRQYSRWLKKVDYPTVHHSEAYRREYQPAYRLLSVQFIPELRLTDAR